MNSVAGNKERLAVSTRGKKYGVSCDGYEAEARSQTQGGRGPPAREPRGAAGRPRALRRLRVCVRGGGSVAGTRTLAGRWEFSALAGLPFPAPLTFQHSCTEREGGAEREGFPWIPVPWDHFPVPSGPRGCTPNE